MRTSRFYCALGACLISSLSIFAHAGGVSGQGTWETTLQGRDLDGDFATAEAYYDRVLNITWLADANNSGIKMDWTTANSWAAGLDPYSSGITGWRLPTVMDTGAPGCDGTNAGTDCGYNVQTTSGSPPYPAVTVYSEMASMFHDTLGNKSYLDPSGVYQPDYGLTNTGPFDNIQADAYWSGTEFGIYPDTALNFYFSGGFQIDTNKSYTYYAWAVHSGDVGVPVTEMIAIDIKPRKNPKNIIDLRKDKELKVAIRGSDTFDALQVNPATVKFGPSEASPINFKAQDYNRDGFSDLILIFNFGATGISCGDNVATLTGETFPEPVTSITGSDSFTVVPCN